MFLGWNWTFIIRDWNLNRTSISPEAMSHSNTFQSVDELRSLVPFRFQLKVQHVIWSHTQTHKQTKTAQSSGTWGRWWGGCGSCMFWKFHRSWSPRLQSYHHCSQQLAVYLFCWRNRWELRSHSPRHFHCAVENRNTAFTRTWSPFIGNHPHLRIALVHRSCWYVI